MKKYLVIILCTISGLSFAQLPLKTLEKATAPNMFIGVDPTDSLAQWKPLSGIGYSPLADSSKWTVSGTNLFPKSLSYNVGIGLNNPAQQLELTGSFRTPTTTSATTGVWYKGTNRFIHNMGTENFFMGSNSGNFTLSGSYNNGIGSGTLRVLSSGNYNSGIGYASLYNLESGSDNVATGIYSLFSNISSGGNVANGNFSLYNSLQGGNTALGYYSGSGIQNGIGGIYIGYYGGCQSTTGNRGNFNIVIGHTAGRTLGSGSSNILIGRLVELALPNTSNQLNIGNAIYATGLGTGSTPSASAAVGIGTSTPAAQLHTTGTVRLAGAGTPGAGKVLTSDADGDATWETPAAGGGIDSTALTAGFGIAVSETSNNWTVRNTRYWNGQDTVKTTLTGLLKASSGVLSAISNGTGFLKNNGSGTYTYDNSTYLTGNQTITLSGDVSGSGTTAITTTIGANKILESMLKAVDTPNDEEYLTYESTTGDFEWQAFSGLTGSGTSGQVPYFTGTSTLASNAGLTYATTGSLSVTATGSAPTSYGAVNISGVNAASLAFLYGTSTQSSYNFAYADTYGFSLYPGSTGYLNSFNIRNSYLKSRFEFNPYDGYLKFYKLTGSVPNQTATQSIVIDGQNTKIGFGATPTYGSSGQFIGVNASTGAAEWQTPTTTTDISTGFFGTDADQNITTSYTNILWDDTGVFDTDSDYSLDGTLGDGFIKVADAGIYEVDAEIVLHNTTEATNHTVEYYLGYYSTVSSTYNYPIGSYSPVRYDYVHAGTKTTATGKMIMQITSPTTQRIVFRIKSSASTSGHVVAKQHNQLTIKKIK